MTVGSRVRVVLIGPPASGKSRIGKRLARTLGVGFTDTDTEVVREHGPIPAIFAEHGEEYFRALERIAVQRALQTDGVVAFGGGAVLDSATQFDIETLPVVLLTVDADAVKTRIANDKRPLVTSVEAWKAIVESRRELYERLADLTVDTSRLPAEQLAREISNWAHNQHTQKELS